MSKIIKLGFFMLYIIFNLNILPLYEKEYLTTRIYLYLWFFCYFFNITIILKESTKKALKLILIVLLSSVALIPIYLKNKDIDYVDYIDLIFIFGFFFIYFSIFASPISKSKNEFEESEYVYGLYDFIFKMILSKILFILFTRSKIKINNIKKIPFNLILSESLEIFFLILSWFYIAKMLTDNKKIMSIIFKSVGGIWLVFSSRLIYILLSNPKINNIIYEMINLKIPQPHNIILYNMCKYPLEIKFRVLTGLILYLIY